MKVFVLCNVLAFCINSQAPSKGRITDLVSAGRILLQEVTCFLHHVPPNLVPVSIMLGYRAAQLTS